MLALAMALVSEPKLLVVDELSLGLAPIVVTELLAAVKALGDRGTAVVLVEQSVDLALSVAERGYVMDNGAITFSGTAEEIGTRPDLLRSIYLAKAGAALAPAAVPETEEGGSQALELRGVTVAFGGIVALDDVSLSVPAGEVVGVIGPNGAGKTTLFDVVSGFVRPTAGRVLVHGVDVTRRGAAARARLGLGRSFQDSRLFGGLTVAESLAVALERFVDVADPLNAVLRMPAYQDTEAAVARRVDELLGLFGLERFAHHLVGELSTGSRRLVDLAAVVGQQPGLVLLDEPTSGVAQREVEAMAEVLARVREHLHATMVLVEHDIGFVSTLADRLVALDRGAVLASGPPRSVLEAPQVEEAFLGMEPTARSRATSIARTAGGSL